MKTVLRSLLFIALLAMSTQKSNAQCTVSNIIIQNVAVVETTPTSCTVRFDVTFNIQDNGGNKFIFIHAWLQNDYPNYFRCVNGQTTQNGSIAAPEASDLGNSILNIGLNNVGATPIVLTSYPPDATVPLALMDEAIKDVLPDGSANITLKGVLFTSQVACSTTPVVIVADLWSSQSASAQRAHCVNCGILYSSGFLSVAGLVNCATLTYNAAITNNTATAISGTYRIFADVNGDGYFTPVTDTLLQNNTSFTVGVGASSIWNVSGPIPFANRNQNVFLVITQTSGAARVFFLPNTSCAPLPVTFSSFIASRTNGSTVVLRWQTETEINNRGFAVQRNMGNNNWETITFISSRVQGGNSNATLVYTYTDINSNKGITQYRIQQVDLDGMSKYSQIRAVRGDAQKSKMIVYPNPSTDGRVTVVFEEKEGARDIILTDMNGRIVQQWKGVLNNTLQIENLGSGMYTLRVTIKETGVQNVGKILVSGN